MKNQSAMFKRILYLALCSIYFYVIHSGGRWNEYPEENYFSALVKILPMAALVIVTWLHEVTDETHSHIKKNVTLGLLFSLLGDICMVWRFDRLLHGMFFFAIAHLCYARAFRFRPLGDIITALQCFVPGLLLFICLVIPNIPETTVKICGLCYSFVITTMWWRCVVYFRSTLNPKSMVYACAGAFIFMTSDSIICVDTWLTSLPFPSILIMVTYYTAQFLIAASVLEYKPISLKTS